MPRLSFELIKGETYRRGGVSLTELREAYRELQDVLTEVLTTARTDTRTSVDDATVVNMQDVWAGSGRSPCLTRRESCGSCRRYETPTYTNIWRKTHRSSALCVERLELRLRGDRRNLDIVLTSYVVNARYSTFAPTSTALALSGNDDHGCAQCCPGQSMSAQNVEYHRVYDVACEDDIQVTPDLLAGAALAL